MIRLFIPDSTEEWRQGRQLVEEYARSLEVDLSFQDFQEELRSLPQVYGPPEGAFLIAEEDGECLGCVALRRFTHEICEMKRLYVKPEQRGRGIGRILATAVINEAIQLGYKRMVLDTLATMYEAHGLYRSLGFQPTAPYRYNPVPGSVFLELPLR